MKKNVAAIFVLIMLLAQIGIAQHNVVHFKGHGHSEHHHDDHNDDHKKNVSETCQTCLLVKSLSFGLVTYHPDLPTPEFVGCAFLNNDNRAPTSNQHALYHARAPPGFLI